MKSMLLVALDLDGTTLSTMNEIPRENREMIRRAQENGVKVIICTGRLAYSAMGYARDLGLTDPVVAMNSAHILDGITGETLDTCYLADESAAACARAAEEVGVYFSTYEAAALRGTRKEFSLQNYLDIREAQPSAMPLELQMVPDTDELLAMGRGKLLKCMIADRDPEKMKRVRALLQDREDITIISSWWNNIEIMPRGVAKGRGVRFVAERCGIPMERVMCIGDNENDWDMLETAGWPVAMGNATEGTKARARYVTDTNVNAGVAKAIERFCLKGDF